MITLLEAALYYAKKGIPVFPLAPSSKIPLKDSHAVKDATTDLKQVEAWWKGSPEANIGAATGFLFDALDLDEGGEESLMAHEPIGKTPETRTPSGGRHLLLAPSPVPLKNAIGALGRGLDFKTAGGYIILPPSKLANGCYKWEHRLNGHFEPVPEWIVEKIRRPMEPEGDAIPAPEIGEGQRNDSLFRFACRLRRSGLDEGEIFAALSSLNDTRVRPKLSKSELRTIAGSAKRYQAEPDDVPRVVLPVERARCAWIGEFETDGVVAGCQSGLALIDDNTEGCGFVDGQMAVVSAYTGAGKTTLMLQTALTIAQRDVRVAYVTFADLGGEQLHTRLVTMLCGWKGTTPPTGVEMHARWAEARALVRTLPIRVYDASEMRHGRYVEEFGEWLEGENVRICFNDYAQEMRSADTKVKGLYEQAEECCGALRHLAARLKIPLVVGSQLTEGNEKMGTRSITKGSRVWEERAGLHLTVRQFSEKEAEKLEYPYAGTQGISEFCIAKNRFGPSRVKAFAQFDRKFLRFTEL